VEVIKRMAPEAPQRHKKKDTSGNVA